MNIKKEIHCGRIRFLCGQGFQTHISQIHTFSSSKWKPTPSTQFFVEQSLYLFEVRHNPEKDQWNTRVFCVTLACAWVIDQNRKTQRKKRTAATSHPTKKRKTGAAGTKKPRPDAGPAAKRVCGRVVHHWTTSHWFLLVLLVDLPPLPYSFLVTLLCCKAQQKHNKKNTLWLSLWSGFSDPYIANWDV